MSTGDSEEMADSTLQWVVLLVFCWRSDAVGVRPWLLRHVNLYIKFVGMKRMISYCFFFTLLYCLVLYSYLHYICYQGDLHGMFLEIAGTVFTCFIILLLSYVK